MTVTSLTLYSDLLRACALSGTATYPPLLLGNWREPFQGSRVGVRVARSGRRKHTLPFLVGRETLSGRSTTIFPETFKRKCSCFPGASFFLTELKHLDQLLCHPGSHWVQHQILIYSTQHQVIPGSFDLYWKTVILHLTENFTCLSLYDSNHHHPHHCLHHGHPHHSIIPSISNISLKCLQAHGLI